MNRVHNSFSTSVKVLRTNNESEFFYHEFRALISSLGILLQTSCVYTSRQNGIVERKHRTILGTRSLKFEDGVPLKFWGKCVDTTVYLLNRIPSRILYHRFPYELLHQHSPYFSHIRVFGCLGYASNYYGLDKFVSKAIPSVFMGYSSTQKSYRLYDLH